MAIIQLTLSATIPRPLVSSFQPRFQNPQSTLLTSILKSNSLSFRRLISPVSALDPKSPHQIHQALPESIVKSKEYERWSFFTAKFSVAANIPFLLLQLPQIILNAQNLSIGKLDALLALSWMGMLAGLLGNLSLLSYFARKKEKEAMVVQTLGVVSTYVVISQLEIAKAMPFPHYIATSIVVASGLILNFLNYFNLINVGIWHTWEDIITVGGLSVLLQVMWSTFVPYIPESILPGALAFAIVVVAVVMVRMEKLSEKGVKFVGAISGWTATLLFMWMPFSQMWTNLVNPDKIKGLSAFTMLLAMIGNGLMIPRALFIRDFMWFTGSVWASVFYGWGNLICLYLCNSISREFFWIATAGLYLWIGIALWTNSIVCGYII